MLAQDDVRFRHHVIQSVGNHGFCPAAPFLGRLEERDQCALPLITLRGQDLHRANKAAHMHVMAASVHDRHVLALMINTHCRACIVQTRCFLDRQRIHVRPEHHHRSGSVFQNPHNPGLPDVAMNGEAKIFEISRSDPGGSGLLERQLGMGVQVFVKLFEVNGHESALFIRRHGLASVSSPKLQRLGSPGRLDA